jgi:peptidoglycan/xylan/chitin deacetylase (PgdA/CDA1 family)
MSGDRFQPLVLCYHAVSDSWPDRLAVGPGMLERQLRSLLRRRYRPASVFSVVGGSGKLLHVTFDDAYRSVANALPVLERLRVPATIFACPGFADDGRALDVPELAMEAAKYPDELATMNWDQLESLVERGVEVGSHTVTHAHLTHLSDAELTRELRESRERLEARLARPCRYLAYPYGEEDARVRASARAAGYAAAFGLPGNEEPVDCYSVPRVGVWRTDNVVRFTVKTMTAGRRLARAAPWLIPRGKPRVPPAPASHSRR